MDLELKDRVAVVTGCSVGIGREVAKVLAAEERARYVTGERLHVDGGMHRAI